MAKPCPPPPMMTADGTWAWAWASARRASSPSGRAGLPDEEAEGGIAGHGVLHREGEGGEVFQGFRVGGLAGEAFDIGGNAAHPRCISSLHFKRMVAKLHVVKDAGAGVGVFWGRSRGERTWSVTAARRVWSALSTSLRTAVVAAGPFADGEIEASVELGGVHEAAEEVAKGFGDIGRFGLALGFDPRCVAAFPFVEKGGQQVFAVLEVPVEAGARDAKAVGQRQDFHAGSAFGDQHVAGGVQPVFAGDFDVADKGFLVGIVAVEKGRCAGGHVSFREVRRLAAVFCSM